MNSEEINDALMALVPMGCGRGETCVEQVANYIGDLKKALTEWNNGERHEELIVDKKVAWQKAAANAREAAQWEKLSLEYRAERDQARAERDEAEAVVQAAKRALANFSAQGVVNLETSSVISIIANVLYRDSKAPPIPHPDEDNFYHPMTQREHDAILQFQGRHGHEELYTRGVEI